jgi:hypothetical protein
MADEIHVFTFTIPANTPITAPVSMPLSMPPRNVTEVDVKVPPGPRGLMGFALGAAGVAVIPAIQPGWKVTDNEAIVWPLSNYIDSGGWEVFGYNLGQYAHSIQITFHCLVPQLTGSSSTQLASLTDINS